LELKLLIRAWRFIYFLKSNINRENFKYFYFKAIKQIQIEISVQLSSL
jgi:hypothetical protein